VWEANHVWLIFVLVVLWTAFSGAFAAVVTTLYIPLTLAAFGMIARGAAFAFRKSVTTLPMRRFFGAAFALSSLVTPFFLGAVVAIVLLVVRRYVLARLASALAVATVLVGWAAAQYPYVLPPALTIDQAARGTPTLVAMLVALVVGGAVLVPALIYLYVLFQRAHPEPRPASRRAEL